MARSKKKKTIVRNGYALAAAHRRSGTMKHRLTPRGGSRNRVAEYMKDAGD